jgi:branched-chain amino acid transport system ATP-binding protein
VLEIRDVECRYGRVSAVRGLSIDVQAGELVSLIGTNGAGKTTTLKCISGLVRAVEGSVTFQGRDITKAQPSDILAAGIAHCPEGRRVFPYMTVEENLQMGSYLRTDKDGVESDLERLFDRFPILKERRRQAAGTLSGGEQQMLAISRALMSRPKLVMFDEPSLGLAPNIVERTFEIIQEICAEGVTILMVEQNAYAALALCDRAYVLESGEVVLQGEGKDLLEDSTVREAYLGG